MSMGSGRVLVTGGTGFLGRPVVRRLVAMGYAVRVLTRTSEKVHAIRDLGAEACVGDVADGSSFGRAIAGCERIVHLAAGTSGSGEDSERATIEGTRNLLGLCEQHRVARLVYVSSCSVYGVADYMAGEKVTEACGLERFPEKRGHYTAAKLEAEAFVRKFMQRGVLPTVILRPGTIYGPGGEIFPALIGLNFGALYFVIGMGNYRMPVVFVDNLVDAVVMSMEKDEAVGQIFNVVDAERIDKRMYIDRVVRRIDPRARVVYIPYLLFYAITWVQERLFGLIKRAPALTCYRLVSSQKTVEYDSSLISARLGWRSTVTVAEATDSLVMSARSPKAAAPSSAG
jgi:nucleoside-diphosphate-sugar epimerase